MNRIAKLFGVCKYHLMTAVMVVFAALMVQSAPTSADIADVQVPSDGIFADIYRDVSPSVVSINVVARRDGNDMFEQEQPAIGSGTGFVLDNEGHIMTNNHVVDGATNIEVSFVDGTLASARVIGLDPDSDLAVIQAELPQEDLDALQPVRFGDSSSLEIGQSVLAIGSPFGQRWTLTSGIISALDRSIQGLTDFSIGGVIQTDAAINPGNSGGPLLNLDGEVIGVNSQIVSATRSNSGIGFAVPGNLAQRVARDLIDSGFVNYSYLGITGRNVDLALIQAFELANDTQGVLVAEAVAGGPASRAGLESARFDEEEQALDVRTAPDSADIITAINGEPLTGINELVTYLAAETQPGDTITLTVLRLGDGFVEERTFDVRLTPRP